MAAWLIALAVTPLVAAVLVVCIREPMRVALPIFAALVPFGSSISIGPSRFGSLSSLVGAILGLGLAFQLIAARRSARRLSLTVPVWLLYLGLAAATIMWTIDRPTTILGLAVLGSLVLVYVFVAMSDVDETVLRRTENGLLFGGVAVVGYGLVQLTFLGGFPADDPSATLDQASPDGRFGNGLLGPGVQALALLLPLLIALSRTFSEASRTYRVVHAVVAAMMLLGVLMTASRTGTLATGIAVLTLALATPRSGRKGLFLAMGLGLTMTILVWVYHPAGLATRTFESVASSSGRIDIWQVGLAACNDYCAYGSGWGTYPRVYAETQASVSNARVLVGEEGSYQPHNLWLLGAVELGVAGLGLLAWGLLTALLDALRLPPLLRGPPLGALLATIFAVFFLSSMEFKFFWMVLIMVAINRNLALRISKNQQLAHPESVPAD